MFGTIGNATNMGGAFGLNTATQARPQTTGGNPFAGANPAMQARPQVQPFQMGQAAGNPFAGSNPASSQFFNNQPRPQVQQPAPQVQPQVQQPTQVPQFYQNYLQSIQPQGSPFIGMPPQMTQSDIMNRVNSGMGMAGGIGDTFNRPLVQLPALGGGMGMAGGMGGMPTQLPAMGGMGMAGVQGPRQMDLSQDAYKRFMSQAQFAGQPPTYDQWVQQSQAPKPMPQVFPQKPGLSTTMQPRPQVSPPNPGLGLGGLNSALQGRQ